MLNFTRIILSILIFSMVISSTGCTVIGYQTGKGLTYDNWEECKLENSSDISKFESGAYIRIITIHGKVVEGEIIEFKPNNHITIFKSKKIEVQIFITLQKFRGQISNQLISLLRIMIIEN